MDRAQRQEEIEFLGKCFKTAQVALCADYRGLTVAQITKLRRELRNCGAQSRVVKNTLARISSEKALADMPAEQRAKLQEIFAGPTFITFSSSDPVAPAKVMAEFMKDKAHEKLKIKGAWLSSGFVDPAGVEALSKMPGRLELLSQLLSLINTPATQLLRLMTTPAAQLVRVIEAQRKKLEEGGQG